MKIYKSTFAAQKRQQSLQNIATSGSAISGDAVDKFLSAADEVALENSVLKSLRLFDIDRVEVEVIKYL
jgi:hypothetical protein